MTTTLKNLFHKSPSVAELTPEDVDTITDHVSDNPELYPGWHELAGLGANVVSLRVEAVELYKQAIA